MGRRRGFPVTADAVVIALSDGEPRVLLIERGNEPFKGRLAFPGGFVDPGEVTQQTAVRELVEETGLDAHDAGFALEQLGAYGPAGGRDPRGETLTVAYYAVVPDVLPVTAADDAAEAQWVLLADAMITERLAFDHSVILKDAVQRCAERYVELGRFCD